MTISNQIHDRIQQFAVELEQLVRQAALEAVQRSLGGSGGGATRAAARPAAAAAAAPRAATARPKKSGGKRDPKVIEALVARVAAFVKEHPGKGVEAIASGLKVTTHDITLPVTKLLASKTIKKKGQKRATKYFPA